MTRKPRLAYVNARVRARKATLLAPAELTALATTNHPEALVAGWSDSHDAAAERIIVALAYSRLTDDYAIIARSLPEAADAIRSLTSTHEIENVKLAWRVALRRPAFASWSRSWRPLGSLETFTLDDVRGVASLADLAAVLRRTPYAQIADTAARAHAADGAAAELLLDRWTTQRLAGAAERLPGVDHAAAALLTLVVLDRDAALVQRAIGALGLSASIALRMTCKLGPLLSRDAAGVLEEWTQGRPARLKLPFELARRHHEAHSIDHLRSIVGATRRLMCARAFAGDPYCLAPALALALLRDEELHGLMSVFELRARHATAKDVRRILSFDG